MYTTKFKGIMSPGG